MTLDEKIYRSVQKLPQSFQEELLDFINFLLMKAEQSEKDEWAVFSLASAISGFEDESEVYSLSDLRIVFA